MPFMALLVLKRKNLVLYVQLIGLSEILTFIPFSCFADAYIFLFSLTPLFRIK